MKESATLELKTSPTKTFLKTVSAFANFGTGRILFGVDDKGNAVGVADEAATRLAIENAINDALDPRPTYYLEPKQLDGATVVELTVYEGPDKPYLCSGKAYRRTDTSTVAVDRSELRRLSIEGSDRPFDDMDAGTQALSFDALGEAMDRVLGIRAMDDDTLKTLGLLREGRFNNAAALLADHNEFPGMEVVRYAADGESMHERATLEGMSVLLQLDRVVEEYRRHYVVERVEGVSRKRREIVPEESFREAVANALVHRLWYVNARTVVSFYPDRIEVVSPGGLPPDVDEELYLEGGISVPRNATLAYVLLRLGIIERLGTGIRRIKRAYEGSLLKPLFSVSAHAIKVTLPVVRELDDLTSEQRAVLACFKPGLELTSSELEELLEASRSTVVRLVSDLVSSGVLVRVGRARSTRYRLP